MKIGTARGLTIFRWLIATILALGFSLIVTPWLLCSLGSPLTISSHMQSAAPMESLQQLYDLGPLTSQLDRPFGDCVSAPGTDTVLIMLKTGATEIYQKLPIHLQTTLKCVPNFMIFSDIAEEFAKYPIHDAIAAVSQKRREDDPDFALYRKLQHYHSEGRDASGLQGDRSWNLDKWKFLPMLHQAFANAGDEINWFVIIEADTSLSWTNLLQWLGRLDDEQPIYSGAQNVIGDPAFAHGGSGIVISRKALEMLEHPRQREGEQAFDEKWEQAISDACCGDEILGRAFHEAGVELTPAWPLLQGETVASLDWTSKHWRTPAISWHHVYSFDINTLWQFEAAWVREHGYKVPYLYRDVFEYFVGRHISVRRTMWNNLSRDYKFESIGRTNAEDQDISIVDDEIHNATTSEEACTEACVRLPDNECVQWMFSPGKCYLSKSIRLGHSDEGGNEHWTSGWIQGSVERFKNGSEDCEVEWTS